MKGFIHSFQSLGATDGPGIRFVVFMQGCNLRCGCCHNPDTWECGVGSEFTPEEIAEKVERYKTYFGKDGGITVSGGEPLLQAGFVYELFRLCRKMGINTCLDTSGSIINDDVLRLLSECDRVLLDIKYTDEESYKRYVGCSLSKPLEFLELLQQRNIPTWLRQVTIPALNDDEENIRRLRDIAKAHSCVEKVELLPFRKICKSKYDNMGIEFPFEKYDVPSQSVMKRLNEIIK
ncbi:MAG: pyruvate formate lyase-activating protein [Clostridia bacterium]|nr:pyruvate formate lyase-activating protein [Clostridia bacterium]